MPGYGSSQGQSRGHSLSRRSQPRILGILRRLHRRRPEIDLVSVSGDIHVANAFSVQPSGFFKALHRFTSSVELPIGSVYSPSV
jgi:hypothetical protein